ncbi:hypothetical protein B7494_g2864 [Chlorociboria aeruginascens]|nr:hypothetical protein B7494_g2864 [Chlorociboria aeruginascens]
MTASTPNTPTKRRASEDSNQAINAIFTNLSQQWLLNVEPATAAESPNDRKARITTAEHREAYKCEHMIRRLYFKDADSLHALLRRFDGEAKILAQGWVNKPRADGDVIPARTRSAGATQYMTTPERCEIQSLLFNILKSDYDRLLPAFGTPMTGINSSLGSSRTKILPAAATTPLPIAFPPRTQSHKTEPKRQLEQFANIEDHIYKKPKIPGPSDLPLPQAESFSNIPAAFLRRESTRSAGTSFTTSIFSNRSFEASTQDTVPDRSDPKGGTETSRLSKDDSQVSESFGSSFDSNAIGNLTVDPPEDVVLPRNPAEQALRERLEETFPEQPSWLINTPFSIRYEATRVFLHAGVSLDENIVLPLFKHNDQFQNYDQFWATLKSLPALKGKSFPERSSQGAWESATDQSEFRRGVYTVIFSASLDFYNADSGPFFNFQLKPMKLDLSHRLDRRFGSDRLLEIKFPDLTGDKLPKFLNNVGNTSRETIIDWLIDANHRIFGRTWKPFFTKPEEKKVLKLELGKADKPASRTPFRVYFFAVEGQGLGNQQIPDLNIDRSEFSIDALLNCIRPIAKNKSEKSLKLFQRTSLALSRTYETVTLETTQIIFKDDLKLGEEEMTDGAGRISWSLAREVVQKLRLAYIPTGFQARIGGAKGFWSVHNDNSKDIWIEVYESQQKWKVDALEPSHRSHRTFEVIGWSGPLKPATLNLQLLPILDNRSKDGGGRESAMQEAISNLLKLGLDQEMKSMVDAMVNSLDLRIWIHEENPGSKNRLKAGVITWIAGLPDSIEEKINLLLDCGFDPKSCKFLQDMVRQLFRSKCDQLKKKLNINVARSTYAYMVPDFEGVLEEGEVFLDFTTFTDKISGLSGVNLKGMEILVARNPAHFVSDIQKVKVVFKEELYGYKDVIVFPTKGELQPEGSSPPAKSSLAAKLSGGDYDGDIAWICWEPSIVDNFTTAEVPLQPDLVKQGFVGKVTTTYEALTRGQANPTSAFLKDAFAFNMQQSLLGSCTKFKERLCYMLKSVDSEKAVLLSTLLGLLVDQPKQGYVFADEDWKRMKEKKFSGGVRTPAYEEDILDHKSWNIIDRLKCTAEKAIESKLVDLNKQMQLSKASYWDDDLVERSTWANKQALTYPEWKVILKHLNDDLESLKAVWKKHFPGGRSDDAARLNFDPAVAECYSIFTAIRPFGTTALTSLLLDGVAEDYTPWALLRASALFATYKRSHVISFPWRMGGRQLMMLKAMKHGLIPVAAAMYAGLKPDRHFISRRKGEENSTTLFERRQDVMEDGDDTTAGVDVGDLELLSQFGDDD